MKFNTYTNFNAADINDAENHQIIYIIDENKKTATAIMKVYTHEIIDKIEKAIISNGLSYGLCDITPKSHKTYDSLLMPSKIISTVKYKENEVFDAFEAKINVKRKLKSAYHRYKQTRLKLYYNKCVLPFMETAQKLIDKNQKIIDSHPFKWYTNEYKLFK